ncbi:MAG TPA: peptidase A24, partial [Croceibacterium sp.]|nr:peptidase A24 [Croceibacterium sp.]
GMVLFALGMWGGGDAKFYAATAGWFALWDFPKLAFAIALTGVVLVLVWFGGRQLRRGPKLDMKSRELPYGVAIAVGGLAALAIGL